MGSAYLPCSLKNKTRRTNIKDLFGIHTNQQLWQSPNLPLTLHWADEVSVFAPYFSPQALVIVVVLQVGWADVTATLVPVTLLLVCFPSARWAILPGSFLVTTAFGSLHLHSRTSSAVFCEREAGWRKSNKHKQSAFLSMNRAIYYLLKQVLETGYRNGLFTASVVKMLGVLLVHISNVATRVFSKFSQRHKKIKI